MASATRPTSESELAALLQEQIAAAADDSGAKELAARRTQALEYVRGVMTDVPRNAEGNRSGVVSRDVADMMGMIMPSLMRVFFGSDHIARYEATRPEAEEMATQATDFVNHVVVKEADGYRQLRAAFEDGLLHGNGFLKHYWDPTPVSTVERFSGLDDAAFSDLVAADDVELLEHEAYPDPSAAALGLIAPPAPAAPAAPAEPVLPGEVGATEAVGASDGLDALADATDAGGAGLREDGAPVAHLREGLPPETVEPTGAVPLDPEVPPGPVDPLPALPTFGDELNAGLGDLMGAPSVPMLHDGKIKRTDKTGRLRLEACPAEQIRIDKNARRIDEREVSFISHSFKKTRSQLIEEGYDPDLVYDLPASTGSSDDDDAERERYTDGHNAADKSMDLIEVDECYVRADMDGDGVAEWIMAVVAGGANASAHRSHGLLNWEEWGDDLPFSDICPDPQPHHWIGRGIFQEMEDIQRVKTVLMRGMLDNLYWVNNPMLLELLNQVENPDALLNPQFGAVVQVKSLDAVKPLVVPFVADKIYPALQLMDEIAEKRTGVSRNTAALDQDALANQTATATNAMQAAAQTKTEDYSRNIAECGGLRRAFSCILRLIVKHQSKARTIRLRGKWVEMDPQSWNAEMDVTINTGLGTGSRDRDLQMLQGIAGKIELVNQALGPMVASKLQVGPHKAFKVYRDMAEAAGVRSPEQYFPEITKEDEDRLIAEQAQQSQAPDPKMLELQGKMQMEGQKQQFTAQLEQFKATQAAQLEQMRLQMAREAEAEKAARDQQMQQMMMDRQSANERLQAEADVLVKRQEAEHKAMLAQQQQAFEERLALMKHEQALELKAWDRQIRLDDIAHQREVREWQAAQTAQASQNTNEDRPQ
jgi:hypothetical protein